MSSGSQKSNILKDKADFTYMNLHILRTMADPYTVSAKENT